MNALGVIGFVVVALFLVEGVRHLTAASAASSGKTASAVANVPAPGPGGGGGGQLGVSASSGQIAQLYHDLQTAGASSTGALNLTAISLRETGGTLSPLSRGVNDNPAITPADYLGTIDRGLFQLNSKAWGDVPDSCAYDYACSIQVVVQRSAGGEQLGAWAYPNANGKTWKDPAVEHFLTVVQAALANL